MIKFLTLGLVAIVAILAIVLTSLNTGPIVLDLYFIQLKLPLALLIYLTLIAGGVASGLLLGYRLLIYRRRISSLERQLKKIRKSQDKESQKSDSLQSN